MKSSKTYMILISILGCEFGLLNSYSIFSNHSSFSLVWAWGFVFSPFICSCTRMGLSSSVNDMQFSILVMFRYLSFLCRSPFIHFLELCTCLLYQISVLVAIEEYGIAARALKKSQIVEFSCIDELYKVFNFISIAIIQLRNFGSFATMENFSFHTHSF